MFLKFPDMGQLEVCGVCGGVTAFPSLPSNGAHRLPPLLPLMPVGVNKSAVTNDVGTK